LFVLWFFNNNLHLSHPLSLFSSVSASAPAWFLIARFAHSWLATTVTFSCHNLTPF